MLNKIPHDVMSFLDKASTDYGKIQQEDFSQRVFGYLLDSKITSPIEQLFYIACRVQCAAQCEEINPESYTNKFGNLVRGIGIHITPQFKIGKYIVDFLLEKINHYEYKMPLSSVIIELDGHAFHDKDKKQRAYEKARDRDLIKAGYRVLHFTGSEVVADPYKVVYEALSLLGIYDGFMDIYDPENPLGIA